MSNNGRRSLTDEVVRKIRRVHKEDGLTIRELAIRFHTSEPTIKRVLMGKACYQKLLLR